MANYQLNYTGAEINTLLGKVTSIETLLNNTATTLNNTVSQTTTNSNNITALLNNTAYETTSFNAHGIGVYLYKWGRVVCLRVNGDITSSWTAGSGNAVTSGLADKWLPLATTVELNSGFEATAGKIIVMTTDGKFYHTTGSTMPSGGRMRCFMTYISKV